MNLDKLREPLPVESIDFRIQSINKGGYAIVLAYKDARVDMQRLDDVVGPLNWKREHTRDNHNCVVSIFNEETGDWVSKEDTGSESFTEAQKGLASDSFKRACFNWGIGRELYDYPLIQVKLKSDEFVVEGNKVKQTWKLKLKEWKWYTEFEEGVLSGIHARDEKGSIRFNWPEKPHPNSVEGKAMKAKKRDSSQIAQQFLSVYHSEGQSPSAILEAWREMNEDEQKEVWHCLNTEEKNVVRQLTETDRKG